MADGNLRDQFNTLMEQMRAGEAEAVKGFIALAASDDMGILLDQLKVFQQKTIPGGHYDQIIGSMVSVITQTRTMAMQTIEMEKTAQQAGGEAQAEDPTT